MNTRLLLIPVAIVLDCVVAESLEERLLKPSLVSLCHLSVRCVSLSGEEQRQCEEVCSVIVTRDDHLFICRLQTLQQCT